MAIVYLGNTISGVSGDTKPTLSANEKGVIFIETDTNKIYQWDTDSWNEIVLSDASTSAKGIASFSSDNFAASSGVITIKNSGVILGTETTGNYVATVAGTSNEVEVSASTGAVTIGIPTNPTLGGNVTVTGNLTVQGDTITLGDATAVNATVLSIDDPTVKMATNNAANSVDIGFYGKYADSGVKYSGLLRDATDNSWYLFNTSGSNDEPTTVLNVSGIGLADLRVGNLLATGNITLTGAAGASPTGSTDLIVPAATADAFQITNGSSSYYTVDTTVNASGIVGNLFDVANPAFASASGSHYHAAQVHTYTWTLTGGTNVTTPVDGVGLKILAPTITSTSATAITQVSTLYVKAPTIAGSATATTSLAADFDGQIVVDESARSLAVDSNSYQVRMMGTSVITGAASGSHGLIANLRVDPLNITKQGGGAIDATAALYIAGAATEGTADYSLWVNDGTIKVGGTSSAQLIDIETTSQSLSAQLKLSTAASATGSSMVLFYEGSGNGTANNMGFWFELRGNDDLFRLMTASDQDLSLDSNGVEGVVWQVRTDSDDIAFAGGVLIGGTGVPPTSGLKLTGTLQVGVDDAGQDVIFYGATANMNMTWDETEDQLILNAHTGNRMLKITVSDDNNLGNDMIQLMNTAGNSVFAVEKSGAVTIGNTAFVRALTIKEDRDGEGGIYIENNSATSGAYAQIALNGNGNNFMLRNYADAFTANANATRFISTGGGSYFVFATQDTDNLVISNQGHIGLNATKRLYFDGAIETQANSGAGSGDTYIYEVTGDVLAIVTGSTESLRIKSNGDQLWNTSVTMDYLWTTANSNPELALQGQTDDVDTSLSLFSKKGDGGDWVYQYYYGKGTPGSVTNRERMLIGYSATGTKFAIDVGAGGSGTVRNFEIQESGTAWFTKVAGGNLTLAPAGNLVLEPGAGGASIDIKKAVNMTNFGIVNVGDTTFTGSIAYDTDAGLTAGTTQTQGGGLALTAQHNQISTCANLDDTVVLPTAVAGLKIRVTNGGANIMRIYPAASDNLGLGVNTFGRIGVSQVVEFTAIDTTNWEVESVSGANIQDFTSSGTWYKLLGTKAVSVALRGGGGGGAGGEGRSAGETRFGGTGGGGGAYFVYDFEASELTATTSVAVAAGGAVGAGGSGADGSDGSPGGTSSFSSTLATAYGGGGGQAGSGNGASGGGGGGATAVGELGVLGSASYGGGGSDSTPGRGFEGAGGSEAGAGQWATFGGSSGGGVTTTPSAANGASSVHGGAGGAGGGGVTSGNSPTDGGNGGNVKSVAPSGGGAGGAGGGGNGVAGAAGNNSTGGKGGGGGGGHHASTGGAGAAGGLGGGGGAGGGGGTTVGGAGGIGGAGLAHIVQW